MSKYYIYQMTAVTEDGTKGSYIGQHKIGRKCPLNDGYKGSGTAWNKYILSQNIPVEKVILRMCDNIEEANYWEQFYIESAKAQGIYLWNRCKGGGSYDHNRLYTKEELKEHKREWRKVNKEHITEYRKRYYEANREKGTEQKRQYYKRPCLYNGETLTLSALEQRFLKAGIEHPTIEAKKYIIENMQ